MVLLLGGPTSGSRTGTHPDVQEDPGLVQGESPVLLGEGGLASQLTGLLSDGLFCVGRV